MIVRSSLVSGEQATMAADNVSEFLGDGNKALLIRPESIGFIKGAPKPGQWTLTGVVDEFFIKGSSTQYRVRVAGLDTPVVMDLPGSFELLAQVGEEVSIGFEPARAFLLSE